MEQNKQIEEQRAKIRADRSQMVSSMVESLYGMKAAIDSLENLVEQQTKVINALASKVSDEDIAALGLEKIRQPVPPIN